MVGLKQIINHKLTSKTSSSNNYYLYCSHTL